jgi:hypothetical protein
MIAEDLAQTIRKKYPSRWLKISVAEDNENGCEIDFPVQLEDWQVDGPTHFN